MANSPARLGSKLGPRVAMLVSQSIVWTHTRLAKAKHAVAMAVFHSMSDEISNEVHTTLGNVFAALHAALPDDSPAKPAVRFMHEETGQLSALAGTGLQASGLLSSIATIMNNELAPAVYDTVRSNPHMLPDIGTIAQMIASQRTDAATGVDAIAAQGIDNGWAENLVSLATQFPAVADGLDMLRRGIITSDQFSQWCVFNSIPIDIVAYYLQTVNGPISVADAALAVLRGDITQDQGVAIAAQNGYSAESFGILLQNTGEPPGLEQLLEGYRRGFIDEATLEKGILQSRYRDEWIPLLEQLRYEPMSVADAVNATVQNQLDESDAATYAQQNGLDPTAFPILLATAGEPLSRTEMEQLYNRGLVDEDDVIQALRESRLKNKYNDLAFELHTKLLDISAISAALRVGVITEDQAVAKAMEYGYSQEDATIAVSAGINSRILDARDKVVSSVVTLTEDGVMSPSDAQQVISSVGYTQDQSQFIIEAANFHLQAKYLASAVTAVRSHYIAHHITQNQASGALDNLGVPASQRDYMLSVWAIEYAANVQAPSGTQIAKAVENGVITAAQGAARLETLGYTADDASIVLGSE